MSSSNASSVIDQKAIEAKIDKIKVCGANRGPPDYIPVSWIQTATAKHVTLFMCRVCFSRVSYQTLHGVFSELTI